jgi:hypothetical protein
MAEQGHFYGHLGDGITWILMGSGFVWLGFKQKTPKKILGMSYRVFASITGAGFFISGVVELLSLYRHS